MRTHRDRSRRGDLAVQDNPRLFGLGPRIGPALTGAVGILVTAAIHDKVVASFEKPLLNGAFKHANNGFGQLISAIGTAGTAVLVGWGARFIVSDRIANELSDAGMIYAGAKALSSAVPNVSVDAQYPDFFPSLNLFGTPAVGGANNAAQMALAAGSRAPLGRSPDVFTDNPRPVAAGSDVGW